MNPSVEYVRGRMDPLLPIVTEYRPRIKHVEGIRAVVFDIYGTLIISAAGDISLVSESESLRGMQEALKILGGEGESARAEAALHLYRKTIRELQRERKGEGVEFPEIEIREVWRAIAGRWDLDESGIEAAGLAYECSVNPCWEMPGASKIVRQIKMNQILLGIVSNAQFYTPAVVEGVCDFTLGEETFLPDLSVFSYREREGKPSRVLFEKIAVAAETRGIQTEEIFYLGNDFTKDVAPACEAGFRTGLFAGDARSLRTGELGFPEASSIADVVLTELAQLEEVLGLSE